jgi:hypothetical protein
MVNESSLETISVVKGEEYRPAPRHVNSTTKKKNWGSRPLTRSESPLQSRGNLESESVGVRKADFGAEENEVVRSGLGYGVSAGAVNHQV